MSAAPALTPVLAPALAIVGRPNVGKSTLINRLAGRRIALVHDMPGVTRDWKQADIEIDGAPFRLIDTAGLEEDGTLDALADRMTAMTRQAMAQADLILFMIDARAGVTPFDEHFGNLIRQSGKEVLLVANKCEGKAGQPGVLEAYALGLGEPIGLSAEHGNGVGDLLDALTTWRKTWQGQAAQGSDSRLEEKEEDESTPLRLVIVGRPNTGKSTFVNTLLGEERLLTGPEAGLTRDAITLPFDHGDQALELIDTAGLRRKARIKQSLEKLSTGESLTAIRYAHVVVLMLDGTLSLDKQDLDIARHVLEEGRNLILAINKWDQVREGQATLKEIHRRLGTSLTQAKGIPVHTLSALRGKNLHRILDSAVALYGAWNWRLATSDLNTWLQAALDRHPPPLVGAGRVKIRYATQVKTRPPTFAFFGTRVAELPKSYERYLENSLREAFDFWGPPLRLHFRQGKNPYA